MQHWRRRYTLLLIFLICGLFFSISAARFAQLVESAYSTRLYYWTIRPYSLLSGIFPFSLAEVFVISVSVVSAMLSVKIIVELVNRPKEYSLYLFRKSPLLILGVMIIYVSFNLMWALNYSRLAFEEIAGLTVEPTSVAELAELSLSLREKANQLREMVDEDEQGVMMLSSSIRAMFSRSSIGYTEASKLYPELRGNYGRPKGVLLSHYWSYTGVSGMYFPFTAEANINTKIPHFLLPATTTHEMAHQRGFAREDEANYIAYLTTTLHPDIDFQYSGVMLALIHTMNQLYRYDPVLWQEIREQYSDGVSRDLQAWQQFREQYRGRVWNISTNVNDSYLRVNRQIDGVHSYGRMVDLLLAEYRMQ